MSVPRARDRSSPGALRAPRFRSGLMAGMAAAAGGLAVLGLIPASASAATSVPAASRAPAPAAAPAKAGPAVPRFLTPPRAPVLPPGVHQVCPTPARPGTMTCMSFVRTNVKGHTGITPDVTPSGYEPAGLQSAYNLTSAAASDGTGETVAIVDPYNDPYAASNLATYRKQYGLTACDTSTGAGCVTIVNQKGQASPLPGTDPTGAWEEEESTDLDMVSAICPNCHILLVEANSPSYTDMGKAEDTAARMAKVVSNSWGSGGEFTGESSYDPYYDHPGVAITFPAGDFGYGTQYPAVSQFVTSVGGTTLERASNTRGWTETVWSYTGSGCATAEPKPAWQNVDNSAPDGCLNRTQNDVAAVANPSTGVAVYDTYPIQTGPPAGWLELGGTSVSSPIIAATYALAGAPTTGTYPASYLYQSGHAADLNPVTSGSNSVSSSDTCGPNRSYLCNGGTGYNGPAGWGTPDGVTAFRSSATGDAVTVADPGTQDSVTGQSVHLQISAVDSASGQTLTYSGTGLPAGLSVSSSGLISSTPTPTSATGSTGDTVTITAKDGSGATGSVTFRWVIYPPFDTAYPGSGRITTANGGKCLDDPAYQTANGTRPDLWTCNGGSNQKWTIEANGTVRVLGKCLDVKGYGTANGTVVDLWSCNGGANQQWVPVGPGLLGNPYSGKCLDDPGYRTANGTTLNIWTCVGQSNEAWTQPVGSVVSAVSGKCLDDPGYRTSNGTQFDLWSCNGGSNQSVTLLPDTATGAVLLRVSGKCLDDWGASAKDGAKAALYPCNAKDPAQQWIPDLITGQLIDAYGKCLEASGTGNGASLSLEDCYGNATEIWQVR